MSITKIRRSYLLKITLSSYNQLSTYNSSAMSEREDMQHITEGKAAIEIPKTVFYNPVQEFNRDISVLVLRTYLSQRLWNHRSEEKHIKGRGGLKILDALSASGLRSMRYAKELGPGGSIVKEIVANDISESAVELIKSNIMRNNLSEKVTSSLSDAITILNLSSASFDSRFHVIDLDPFGTGAQFFDAAVRSIGEAGLLMVTCTDTAVLCGNASESCFARYGSMSMRADFCHEAALRVILRSLESHAAVYGRYIKPLLCLSVDFYVRLFVQVFTQPSETKKSASKLSMVYLCKECKNFELNPLGTVQLKEDPKQATSNNDAVKYNYKLAEVKIGDRCDICGGAVTLGGPIWSGPIHDKSFLKLLRDELDNLSSEDQYATFKRISGMIQMCIEELDVPLFYGLDSISSKLRMKLPRDKDVYSALLNAGYSVSSTHTNKKGMKTNAPSSVVWDIFCQIARDRIETIQEVRDESQKTQECIKKALADRIISRRPKRKLYDFSPNASFVTESRKMIRFQMNPTKNWGPKPRPSG